MEKIHFTVILSALVICFNMQIRGNYGITAQHFVFNGSSYKFHASSKHGQNWGESRGACKETGSDLVSIESLEEWVFLNNTIQTMKTGEYFIGLKKNVKSREWRWISDNSKLDATKGTFPWATSQPSGDKDGYCVVMYKNYLQDYGKYNDVSCKAKFQDKGYICESHNESNGKDGPTVKGTSQTNRVNKERATKPTTRQSSTVTSATRLTLSIRPLKEANSEGLTVKRTSQTEGGSTEPATKPTTMQSFLVTAVLPRSPLTKVNSEATTARNTVENLPSEHTASNSSNLIVIVLTLLAFLILIILIIFCVISIRRRRNFKNQGLVKSKVVSDALTKSPQAQDNSQMGNILNTWRAQRNLQYM